MKNAEFFTMLNNLIFAHKNNQSIFLDTQEIRTHKQ